MKNAKKAIVRICSFAMVLFIAFGFLSTTRVSAAESALSAVWTSGGTADITGIRATNNFEILGIDANIGELTNNGKLVISVPTSAAFSLSSNYTQPGAAGNKFTNVEKDTSVPGVTTLTYTWDPNYTGPLHVDIAVRANNKAITAGQIFTITSSLYLDDLGAANKTVANNYQVYDFKNDDDTWLEGLNMSFSQLVPKTADVAPGGDAKYKVTFSSSQMAFWEKTNDGGPTYVGTGKVKFPAGTQLKGTPPGNATIDANGWVTFEVSTNAWGSQTFEFDVTFPSDLGAQVGETITFGDLAFDGYLNNIKIEEHHYTKTQNATGNYTVSDQTAHKLNVELYVPNQGSQYYHVQAGANNTEQAFAWLSVRNFGSTNLTNLTVDFELPSNVKMHTFYIPKAGTDETSKDNYWLGEVTVGYSTNLRAGPLTYAVTDSGYYGPEQLGLAEGEYITALTMTFPNFRPGDAVGGAKDPTVYSSIHFVGDIGDGTEVVTKITSVKADGNLGGTATDKHEIRLPLQEMKNMSMSNTFTNSTLVNDHAKMGDTFTYNEWISASDYYYNGTTGYLENPTFYIAVPEWGEYVAGSFKTTFNPRTASTYYNINTGTAAPLITLETVDGQDYVKIEYSGKKDDASYLRCAAGTELQISVDFKILDTALTGYSYVYKGIYASATDANARKTLISSGWSAYAHTLAGSTTFPDYTNGTSPSLWVGNNNKVTLVVDNNPVLVIEGSGSIDGQSFVEHNASNDNTILPISFEGDGYYRLRIVNRTAAAITNLKVDLVLPANTATGSAWVPKVSIVSVEKQTAAGYTDLVNGSYTQANTNTAFTVEIPSLPAGAGIVYHIKFEAAEYTQANAAELGEEAYATVSATYTGGQMTRKGAAFALEETAAPTLALNNGYHYDGTPVSDSSVTVRAESTYTDPMGTATDDYLNFSFAGDVYIKKIEKTTALNNTPANVALGHGTAVANVADYVADCVEGDVLYVTYAVKDYEEGLQGVTLANAHEATATRTIVVEAPLRYTVKFDSQGGSSVADITGVVPGSMVTPPSAPTRSGYTFGGWYQEAGCTTPWNFASDTVNSDITLYAKWTQNTVPPVTPPASSSSPTSSRPSSSSTAPASSAGPDSSSASQAPSAPASSAADSSVVGGNGSSLSTVDIDDDGPPLFGQGNHWALANLICAAISLLGGAVALIVGVRRRKRDDVDEEAYEETEERKKGNRLWPVLGAVSGVASPIVFFLTENMRLPMAIFDKWTPVMLAILVAQGIFAVLQWHSKRRKDDEAKYADY